MLTEQSHRLFGLKPLHLVSLAMVAMALLLGISAMRSSITPYVSVAEARATGRNVQVYGFLNDQGGYNQDGHFRFALQDEQGQVMEVVYPKGKPANFEQAIGIVAIGYYDAASNTFQADDLLVKCPSKYQEQTAQDLAPQP
ncbi:MAG: hypothetical protein KatS3mg057_0820 [Herpetosiphonaceae bacterium]|nr:MAG: hypothetical protein KatS3mg057_0820 [Herpetosiphonaceae bacterium]